MGHEIRVRLPGAEWWLVHSWQWHGQRQRLITAAGLDIDTDDIIYIANNDWESANLTRSAIQPVQRNVWQHWRIDALFSPKPGQSDGSKCGLMRCWRWTDRWRPC